MRIRKLLVPGAAAVSVLVMAPALTSCSDGAGTDAPAAPSAALSIDGTCNIYELADTEGEAWTIASAPEWVTPVRSKGAAGEAIELYVESNSTAQREGEITIEYTGGKRRAVPVKQSTTGTTTSMQRTYAAGWSFDIRTYMDFRGLRGQIFNTQKIKAYDPDCYRVEVDSKSDITYYYGESGSELADDMNAKLDVEGKFNSFSLDLQGSFGKSALSDSRRIFSKIRAIYRERRVYLNQLSLTQAQNQNLFTAEFAAERRHVIDSEGSDESIRNLIEHYGTHFVQDAFLGGFYDYYFSSVVENMSDMTNVQAAINFGFSEKFNLKGNGDYKDEFEKLNTERIEKFSVKGGDAISLSQSVEDGTICDDKIKAWRKTLQDGQQYELLTFVLKPISSLFPRTIKKKIDNYMERMYYSEIPVTRSAE